MKISKMAYDLIFMIFEFKDHVDEECQRIIEVRDALASGERGRISEALDGFYYNASILVDGTLVMSKARRIRSRIRSFGEGLVIPTEIVEEVLGTMYAPLVSDIKMITDYNIEQGLCCDGIGSIDDLEQLLCDYLKREEKVLPKRAEKHVEVFMSIKEACIDYRGVIALLTSAILSKDAGSTKDLLDRSVKGIKAVKHRCVIHDTYYSVDWRHED